MSDHMEKITDPSRWTCPNCGRENGPEGICPGCGFDNSTNYLAYPTLTPLPQPKVIRPVEPTPEPKPSPEPKPEPKKKRWWLVVAVLAVALLVVWFSAYYSANHTKVANYLGMDIDSAASQAGEELTVSQTVKAVSSSEDYGVVVEQSVSAGTTVEKGSSITLSYGVPDFEGLSWQDACDLAEAQGLSLVRYCTESSAEAGAILSADYSSESAVSVEVAIPVLAGMDKDTALSQLEAAFGSVDVTTEEEYSDSVERGSIIDYDISLDDGGLLLYLTVSSGPEYVAVPDLAGMTPEEAQAALEAVGLVYEECSYTCYSTYEAGCVAFISNYDVGDTVRQGTSILAWLSEAKIEHSGLVTADKTEITLTPGGDAVTVISTISSGMWYCVVWWSTDRYDVTDEWNESGVISSVSTEEDAGNGWIQVRVWPSESSYNNGDLPSDFVNIRVYVDAS